MTFIVLTEREICERFNVTPEQIDRASRVIDRQGEVFYQVTSQTIDAVYTVRAHCGGHKLTCTCPAGNPPRDKYGVPLSPIIPCWHKRAARAAAFEHKQAENLQARQEAEAAALAKAESERRAVLPLNGNQGFSLTKQAPTVMRGFDIRYAVAGDTWQSRKAHGFAPVGQLPAEWTAITGDPNVISAVCFPSNQRGWQAQKRKHVAEFARELVTA